MITKNNTSSDYIKKIQNKTLYANLLIQRQKVLNGCSSRVQITSGSAADNSSSEYTKIVEGTVLTTAAEQANILSLTYCPIVAAPAPAPAPGPPPLRLLVLGDATYQTAATNISNRLTALGYTSATVASAQLGTTYTGSAINTATYNVVLMYTNASQTGAPALSTNLKNFVDAGGHFVTMTFIWNLNPTGFDDTITPFTLTGQQNDPTGNMTVSQVHPITTGVATNITNGVLILNNGNVGLQTGTTVIATYTSTGVPYVGIRTRGSSRLVGLNVGGYKLDTYANLINLTTNACLWANGNI